MSENGENGKDLEAPRLVRESDGAVVAERVELARTFGSRLAGLMLRGSLDPRAAVWIEPCSSIHMMLVRFPIDAVFLDEDGNVLKVSRRVRPWLGLAACRGARSTVELASGVAERSGLSPGDRLRLAPRERA